MDSIAIAIQAHVDIKWVFAVFGVLVILKILKHFKRNK